MAVQRVRFALKIPRLFMIIAGGRSPIFRPVLC